jgi:pimeloyl-ACP methyl ester carboxylesterase
MEHKVQEEGTFKYLEIGSGKEVIMLLHGLFGSLSNFKGIIDYFSDRYKVVIPILPIYELPLRKVSVKSYADYVLDFISLKGYNNIHLLGNSLGGHISQVICLEKPDKIRSLTLTGSSGLFENSMGNTFLKRNNYEFIKKKAESTFYDPATATKEMIDEVYNSINDRSKALSLLASAKSAIRENLEDKISTIMIPTLLIWGKEDIITPPFVAQRFHDLLPNSKLHFISKCGHAPMMEKPNEFNKIFAMFLSSISYS